MNSRFTAPGRWLLPVMFLILAVLATLSTLMAPSTQNQEPLADRSVYNSEPSGYRAWYLVAQKTGLPLSIWDKSFEQLNRIPEPATMMLIDPYTVSRTSMLFGHNDADRVLNWVAKGNTLLMLDDFHRYGAQRLLQRMNLTQRRSSPPPRASRGWMDTLRPLRNWDQELGVYVTQPLLSQSALKLSHTRRSAQTSEVILTDEQGNPKILRFAYGKGAVLLGTVSDLGDNQFLHKPANDNYQFLSNLLRREGNPVFINEYVHGYAETENLFTYLGQNTPLGSIFAQMILGFVLLLWLSLKRWTPKPQEQTAADVNKAAPTGLEAYIQSMARLYYRSQAAALVLEPQLARIQTLLRQRFRFSLDDEGRLKHLLGTFPEDYSSKEDSPEALLGAIHKARTVIRNQERLSHRDLLRLARQLALIEERLHYERHRSYSVTR